MGGQELVLLRFNCKFTLSSSYGSCRYEYAIAIQWYQFHPTDALWFSFIITCGQLGPLLLTCIFYEISIHSQTSKYNLWHLELDNSRWSMVMDKDFHAMLYWSCDYSLIQGLKLP